MFKNTASQKIQFWAYLSTTVKPQTGDAANITAYVSIDGGAVTVLGDTSATELSATNAPGSYQFDLTQAETNGNVLLFTAKSGTANVVLYPVRVETTAPGSNALTTATIATGVWQDAVGADFTAANSIGKSLYTGGVVPGGVNGLFMAGTNAAITVAGWAVTNNITCANFTISGAFNMTAFNAINFTLASNNANPAFEISASGGGPAFRIEGDVAADALIITAGVGGRDVVLGGDGIIHGTIDTATTVGTVNALAANVVDATALAASAVTKIAAGVWDALTTGFVTVGSIGKAIVTYITGLGGAFNITITVVDNFAVPLQNVRFNVFDGTNQLIASGFTDVLGQSTDSYPAGTYTVALVKANYLFATLSRTVTGNQTGTLKNNLVMTVVTPIIPPANPLLQTVTGTLFGPAGIAVNKKVTFSLVPKDSSRPLTVAGNVSTFENAEVFTDGTGTFSINLPQTILYDDPPTYHIVCEAAGIDKEGVTLGAAPLDIATL